MISSLKQPQHITIIMDGNGRWASQRQLNRTEGHREGARVLHDIITACVKKKIQVLSVFAFSSDNWRRPTGEVDALMELFSHVLERDVPKLHDQNVQMQFIGDCTKFPENLQRQIHKAIEKTGKNTGLILVTAVNYSGYWDICQASQKLVEDVEKGVLLKEAITPEVFSQKLATAFLPNPDLFIRTSGEQRLSNFMMWPLAYTELYFCSCYWPDFTVAEFDKALAFYAGRERRFGCTSEQLQEP